MTAPAVPMGPASTGVDEITGAALAADEVTIADFLAGGPSDCDNGARSTAFVTTPATYIAAWNEMNLVYAYPPAFFRTQLVADTRPLPKTKAKAKARARQPIPSTATGTILDGLQFVPTFDTSLEIAFQKRNGVASSRAVANAGIRQGILSTLDVTDLVAHGVEGDAAAVAMEDSTMVRFLASDESHGPKSLRGWILGSERDPQEFLPPGCAQRWHWDLQRACGQHHPQRHESICTQHPAKTWRLGPPRGCNHDRNAQVAAAAVWSLCVPQAVRTVFTMPEAGDFQTQLGSETLSWQATRIGRPATGWSQSDGGGMNLCTTRVGKPSLKGDVRSVCPIKKPQPTAGRPSGRKPGCCMRNSRIEQQAI